MFDRWGTGGRANMGLTKEDAARMPHDYDYSKHMRARGGGYWKEAAGAEVPGVGAYFAKAAPEHVDESGMRCGGRIRRGRRVQ